LTAEKRAQILLAFTHDRNLQRVAKQVGGISHESVRKVAKEEGVELAKRSEHTKLPEFKAKATETLKRMHANPESAAKSRAAGIRNLKRWLAEQRLKKLT
jgi:tRNA U34 2-thiouridine synthase MnmA/TrmU